MTLLLEGFQCSKQMFGLLSNICANDRRRKKHYRNYERAGLGQFETECLLKACRYNKCVHVLLCISNVWVRTVACATCEVLSLPSCGWGSWGWGGVEWWWLYQVYAWSCLGNLTQRRSHCHNNATPFTPHHHQGLPPPPHIQLVTSGRSPPPPSQPLSRFLSISLHPSLYSHALL